MTNIKRFQWVFIKDSVVEFQDNGFVRVCNSERLEEFLNELAKENEEINESVVSIAKEYSEQEIIIDMLQNENEQLKQQLQSLLKLTKKIEDCTYDMKLIGDVE